MDDTITIPVSDATARQLLRAVLERLVVLEERQMALSDKLEAALTDLQADVKAVLTFLKSELPALKAKITDLEGEVTTLQGDKTAALAMIDDLKARAAGMETEVLERIQGVDDTLEAELPPTVP